MPVFTKPFEEAVNVTTAYFWTECVWIGTASDRLPAGTVTDAGTDAAAGLELESATVIPPAGAAAFKASVRVVGVPPAMTFDETLKPASQGSTVRGAVVPVPAEAVSVTDVDAPIV